MINRRFSPFLEKAANALRSAGFGLWKPAACSKQVVRESCFSFTNPGAARLRSPLWAINRPLGECLRPVKNRRRKGRVIPPCLREGHQARSEAKEIFLRDHSQPRMLGEIVPKGGCLFEISSKPTKSSRATCNSIGSTCARLFSQGCDDCPFLCAYEKLPPKKRVKPKSRFER
jgi:hypothetical protein